MLHFLNAPTLGDNNGVQDWNKFRADIIVQRIFGHTNAAKVMRNHLPYKIGVDIVCRARCVHLTRHSVHNIMEMAVV